MDQTDDPDDRKVIRERIKELRTQQAAAKKEADEKLAKLTNTRDEMLKKKKAEAEAQKQRTMQMYDNMAKSAPAGANKQMDTSILRTETKETKSEWNKYNKQLLLSFFSLPPSPPPPHFFVLFVPCFLSIFSIFLPF